LFATRKKKSKSKPQPDNEKDRERDLVKELLLKDDDTVQTGSPSGSGRSSPAVGGSSVKKTEAERRFEEVQKRRVGEFT
jgi:protein FAM32A